MLRKHALLTLMAAGATLALPAACQASTYDLNLDTCSGGCGLTDYGSVSVTGSSTSLTFTVTFNSTAQFDPPTPTVDAFWFDITGTVATATTSSASNNIANPGWSFSDPMAGSFNPNPGNFGNYNEIITCTTSEAGHVCGQSLIFTITGTGLGVGFTPGKGATAGDNVYMVADVSNNGSTGLVGAQLSQTPLPAALPLFAGGLGLIGLLSRRRRATATSIFAS